MDTLMKLWNRIFPNEVISSIEIALSWRENKKSSKGYGGGEKGKVSE